MNENAFSNERRDDLLVQRATIGLSPNEQRELQELLAANGEVDEAGEVAAGFDSLELPAAAIDLALTGDRVLQPPAWLADKVAARIAAEKSNSGEAPKGAAISARDERRGWMSPLTSREWLSIACALAIAMVAAFVWYDGKSDGRREAPEPTAAQQLDDFLSEPPQDLVRLAWTPTEDPAAAGASGEVVWSDSEQKGFMIFRGLPVNDAALEQYQLWIFDETRDAAQPVDGGVFDIATAVSGEASSKQAVVVPIHAKLPVRQATMFAITIEPPGGVVVSKRERLPLLAKLGE
jgi:hypothetical protein